MEDKLLQEATEFLRRSGDSHTSPERIHRRLGWKHKVAAEVVDRLVGAGVLGPRETPGYPVLIQRLTDTSATASGESTAAPAADVAASTDTASGSKDPNPPPGPQDQSAPAEPQSPLVPLKRITRDPSIQPRAGIDREVVVAYADVMMAGVKLPPVILYDQGDGQLILADGWHRVAAAEEVGLTEITATVIKGSKREATLRAIEANVSHGKSLTNEEKRKAALRLLADGEWGQWSDAEIARRCGFSAAHVGRLRKDHSNNVTVMRKCRSKNGKVRVMKTSKMGKKRRTPAPNCESVQTDVSATAAVQKESQSSPDSGAATIEHSLSLMTKGATSFLAVPEAARAASLRALEPTLLLELRDLLTKVFNQLPPEMRAAA